MEEAKPVELGEKLKGEIELPSIDIAPHVGKMTKIEKVNTYEGQHGFYVKAESEVLETIEGGKEVVELRATRIFGLQEDAEGNIGWGKNTNLGVFLEKMGVTHFNDLVGKEIQVTKITNKNDKKDYLSM